ncbi:MAG: ATP-binding protein [Tepidisphaerales bacterium]
MNVEGAYLRVWQRYAMAVLAVAAGTAARLTILRSLGTDMPFVTFYPAVMIAALYAGLPGGLLATVLSAFAALFWIEPMGRPWADDPVHWLGTAFFVACCTMISWLCDAMRRAQTRASQAEAQVRLASERERAAEALRQSEERLRFHVENTPLAVIEWGADFHISRWSAEAERIFGWRADEILGKRLDEFRWVFEEDAEQVARVSAGLVDGTRRRSVSHNRNYRKDGSVVHCVWYNSSLVDASGKLVSILSLVLDVTEQKRSEAALVAAKISAEQAKAVAERASKAKDQFLAALSHELRTPLTPVVAAAGALLRDPRLAPDVREDLETIHRNVGLEVALINDLLDVTRIASGKLVLQKDVVDAVQVLRDAARICSGDLDGKSQILTIDTTGAPCPVEADAARLHQVFWNLIKNAIKFTPPGGRITIACRRTGGPDARVAVSVSDTGIGIDPGVLPRLFVPFEQGDEETTHRFGGLGLGLAITRAIVELHDGRISAASAGRGRGATFVVELPVASCQLPEETGDGRQPLATNNSQLATRSLRILLVEDHVDTARMMARLLTAEGHSVVHAGNVKDGLAAADADAFDVLVSDLGLPDGDGHSLLRQLRERGSSMKAIALSGYGAASDLQKSREAGFSEHITKPVDLDALYQALIRVASAGRSESLVE